MAKTIVVPIEGFLKNPVGGQINEDAYYFYRTLSGLYDVILVSMYDGNRANVRSWLAMEGIHKYADIVFPDFVQFIADPFWVNLCRVLSTRGYNLAFWLVTSPQDAMDLLAWGETTVLWTKPEYALPEWMPGENRGHVEWEALAERTMRQKAARALDKRTETELE